MQIRQIAAGSRKQASQTMISQETQKAIKFIYSLGIAEINETIEGYVLNC